MRITKKIKEQAMVTAINDFMSDWDGDMGCDKFMEQLSKAKDWDDVSGYAWEPFEYHTPEQVYDYIDSLYNNIIDIFKGVK